MNLKTLGFFLLILTANKLTAQAPPQYSSVDALVTNFPFNVKSVPDLRILQSELKRQLKSEDEFARAAFVWISNNIAYDCEGLNNKSGLTEIEEVIANKRGICAGYANLFKDFCDQFGVECAVVHGIAITNTDVIPSHADSIEADHAWNAVKINGTWKLVDPTWGSGSTSSGCLSFTRERDEKYFYPRPEEFIKDHFPLIGTWQILDKTVTAQQFLDSARKRREEMKKLYEGESVVMLPKDSIIAKKVGQMVRFTFMTKAKANKAIVWSEDNAHLRDEGKLVVIKNGYYYEYKIKYPGNYHLYISLCMDPGQGGNVSVIHSGYYVMDIQRLQNTQYNPIFR